MNRLIAAMSTITVNKKSLARFLDIFIFKLLKGKNLRRKKENYVRNYYCYFVGSLVSWYDRIFRNGRQFDSPFVGACAGCLCNQTFNRTKSSLICVFWSRVFEKWQILF